jgi:hypothetical protein
LPYFSQEEELDANNQDPKELMDRYLKNFFYDLTYLVYVPIISALHLPLIFLIIYNLYIDGGRDSPLAPYFRIIIVVLEFISCFVQFVFCFYILLSPTGTYLIKYHFILWKYTYAGLLYGFGLFLSND